MLELMGCSKDESISISAVICVRCMRASSGHLPCCVSGVLSIATSMQVMGSCDGEFQFGASIQVMDIYVATSMQVMGSCDSVLV